MLPSSASPPEAPARQMVRRSFVIMPVNVPAFERGAQKL
jgi:hypothetical protein